MMPDKVSTAWGKKNDDKADEIKDGAVRYINKLKGLSEAERTVYNKIRKELEAERADVDQKAEKLNYREGELNTRDAHLRNEADVVKADKDKLAQNQAEIEKGYENLKKEQTDLATDKSTLDDTMKKVGEMKKEAEDLAKKYQNAQAVIERAAELEAREEKLKKLIEIVETKANALKRPPGYQEYVDNLIMGHLTSIAKDYVVDVELGDASTYGDNEHIGKVLALCGEDAEEFAALDDVTKSGYPVIIIETVSETPAANPAEQPSADANATKLPDYLPANTAAVENQTAPQEDFEVVEDNTDEEAEYQNAVKAMKGLKILEDKLPPYLDKGHDKDLIEINLNISNAKKAYDAGNYKAACDYAHDLQERFEDVKTSIEHEKQMKATPEPAKVEEPVAPAAKPVAKAKKPPKKGDDSLLKDIMDDLSMGKKPKK
jgi:hypothetical protein